MWIIKYKTLFLTIAAVIVVVSATVVALFGIRPGIDFTGGSLLEVRYEVVPERSVLESELAALGYENALVRQSESELGSGYLISTRDLTDPERIALEDSTTSLGQGGEVVRFTSIGPTIGAELKDKAVWAIGGVLLITIIYVAFAFAGVGTPVKSWTYGFLVTLILAHDILVPIAVMSLMGYFIGVEADILFVTALLTILGYSVNDTIVIFDRVREKLKQNRKEEKIVHKEVGGIDRTEVVYTLTKPFADIVGQAVDETMARSINTSLTVLIALVALYAFGSAVTQTFTLTLIVGVIAGAYSSIFIASPLLVLYAERFTKTAAVVKKFHI